MNRKPSTTLWSSPAFVLYRLIPIAYSLFFAGFIIAFIVSNSGRPVKLENAIISDLLSRFDNTRGYYFAAFSTVIYGLLLLPAATLFQNNRKYLYFNWSVIGAWLFRIGLISTVAIGITTFIQHPYSPVHVWLSFLAFISMLAGLSVCFFSTAISVSSRRFHLIVLGAIQVCVLVYLIYIFFCPDYFNGRRWFLAALEWGLIIFIDVNIIVLTYKLEHNKLKKTK